MIKEYLVLQLSWHEWVSAGGSFYFDQISCLCFCFFYGFMGVFIWVYGYRVLMLSAAKFVIWVSFWNEFIFLRFQVWWYGSLDNLAPWFGLHCILLYGTAERSQWVLWFGILWEGGIWHEFWSRWERLCSGQYEILVAMGRKFWHADFLLWLMRNHNMVLVKDWFCCYGEFL